VDFGWFMTASISALLATLQATVTAYYLLNWRDFWNDVVKPIRRSMGNALDEATEDSVYEAYSLLTKSSMTRALSNWEKENLSRTRMTIGVTSKQWGKQTNFGWSICYRRVDTHPFLGGGAQSVMKTTSFSEPILGELYAARAAITTLQRTMSTQTNHLIYQQINAAKSGKTGQNHRTQSMVAIEQGLGTFARLIC
jgi:hypothetical protein